MKVLAYGNQKERRYVDVIARWGGDGRVTPLFVCWPDGRTFQVDRVLGEPAANAFASAGSRTLRYRVSVEGRVTNLFLERSGEGGDTVRWYVEERRHIPLWSMPGKAAQNG